jgi:hypothetical protein
VEEKDKISIMLAEYGTIRAELLQRNTVMNQVFTVGGTIAAGVIGAGVQLYLQHGFSALPGVATVLLVTATFVGFTWREIDKEARRANRHLVALEKEINRRAGETLLSWESTFGLDVDGYMWIGKAPPS